MTAIELADVAKAYKKQQLFSGVSVRIERGTITGLVGPNGSGKSVLLRIMCGFVMPDEGRVTIAPEFFDSRALFPAEFGVMIDRPGYVAHATGFDNLMQLANIRREIGERDVREWMSRVGLDPDNRTRVRNYSLGMKQKLAITQAMMENQRVLILDEPFNALDESSRTVVRELMAEHRRSGGTIVFTSHDRRDIEELAEHKLTIDGGTIRGSEGGGF